MRARPAAILTGFTILLAGPFPALGQATSSSSSGYRVEVARTESDATVLFTTSVSVNRLSGMPRFECELRSDTNYGRAVGSYGGATDQLNVDSVTGSGTTPISIALKITDMRTGRPLGTDKLIFIRCSLNPPFSGQASERWFVSSEPPVCRPGQYCPLNYVKPGAVLEVSGQAQ